MPEGSAVTELDAARGWDRQQMTPDAVLNKAPGVPTSAAAHKGESGSILDGGESEAGVEGQVGPMQQEEEVGAAFELPSQMPRELQSWAWDK